MLTHLSIHLLVNQGDGCTTAPVQFAGVVGSDEEVNIMTSTECTDDGTCG